jgi:hypothetical protein
MDWDLLLVNICRHLESGVISEGIEREEHFERQFVEEIVRSCVASHPSREHLCIATHPWMKPDTEKPYSAKLREQIRCWKECKEWANATGWGDATHARHLRLG